jgi:hypothetical protein
MLAIATTTGLRAQQQIETTRSEIAALQQEKVELEAETDRAIRNLRLAEAKQQQAVDAANQANQDLQAAVERETEAQGKVKAAEALAAQAQQTQQQAEVAAAEAERKQQAAEAATAAAQQANVQSSTAYEKTLEDLREQWQRGDRQAALIRLAMARICQLEGYSEEAELRACIQETLDATRSQISE